MDLVEVDVAWKFAVPLEATNTAVLALGLGRLPSFVTSSCITCVEASPGTMASPM